MRCFQKKIPIRDFANLVKGLVNALKASKAATKRNKNEVEGQKWLVSVAWLLKDNVLNDVTNLIGLIEAPSTREVKRLSSEPPASSQITRATAEIRQARNTLSRQSEELAKHAQLKMSMKFLWNSVAFHEASKNDLKSALAAAIMEVIRIS